MHGEDDGQGLGLGTHRAHVVAGDGCSNAVGLEIEGIECLRGGGDGRQARIDWHLGELVFLRGPEGVEVVGHRGAALDLGGIDGGPCEGCDRRCLGSAAIAGAELKEARLIETALHLGDAIADRGLARLIEWQAVLGQHPLHLALGKRLALVLRLHHKGHGFTAMVGGSGFLGMGGELEGGGDWRFGVKAGEADEADEQGGGEQEFHAAGMMRGG